MVPHIASPAKVQYLKFEVWFVLNAYHFCTLVKSKIISQTIVSQGLSVGIKIQWLYLEFSSAAKFCHNTVK